MKGQLMDVPFSPPDITESEINLVAKALRSGWITTGPMTRQFEGELAELCATKRAICLNSATAAMELTLRMLGIGPGDEVITCAYTYTASASVAVHVGARPVLVDCLPGSPHMSPEALKAAITEKTKAIIPIDIAGIPADYEAIRRIVEDKRNLFKPNSELQQQLGRIAVIGDAAHSLGARYMGKSVALASDFCCFSFHAVKNLTTAEGGCIAFNDIGNVSADEMYRRLSLLSLHGQDKDALAKTQKGAWEYDIVVPGYKCNMTDMAAALGLAQLARLGKLYRRRSDIVDRYDSYFKDTVIKPLRHVVGRTYHGSHHLYIVSVGDVDAETRNEIILDLAENGVVANVHYKPLPMMTAYKELGWDIQDFPNAYNFYKSEITLPLHTLLTDEQVDYTARALLASVKARVG